MADLRIDVDLVTSLRGLEGELKRALRPVEELLRKTSGNEALSLELSKKGAGLFQQQMQQLQATLGLDPKVAESLSKQFRGFVGALEDYERALSSKDYGALAERQKTFNARLEGLLQGLDSLAQALPKPKKLDVERMFKFRDILDTLYSSLVANSEKMTTIAQTLTPTTIASNTSVQALQTMLKQQSKAFKAGQLGLEKYLDVLHGTIRAINTVTDPQQQQKFIKNIESGLKLLPEELQNYYGGLLKAVQGSPEGIRTVVENLLKVRDGMKVHPAIESTLKKAKTVAQEMQLKTVRVTYDKAGEMLGEIASRFQQEIEKAPKGARTEQLKKLLPDVIKARTQLLKGADLSQVVREYSELFTKVGELDSAIQDYAKSVRGSIAELRQNLPKLKDAITAQMQNAANEYVLSKGLQEAAPDVNPNQLFATYRMINGIQAQQKLMDAFTEMILRDEALASYVSGLTAQGLRDTVSRTVGHLAQGASWALMTGEAGAQLMKGKDPQAWIRTLDESLRLFADVLVDAPAFRIREVAEEFYRDGEAAKRKYQLSLANAKGVGEALNGIAEILERSLGPSGSLHNLVHGFAIGKQLNEFREANPYAAAASLGRQIALDERHHTYFKAFLPQMYAQYDRLQRQGDPRAVEFMSQFVSRFAPSIDAAHGLMLNTFANFVSGLMLAGVFGIAYQLTQHIQQMQALNKQLLAYKNILIMRGEQQAANDIGVLRDRIIELSKTSRVAVQDVANLFGTLIRNSVSTQGLEQLVNTMARLNETFGLPFDSIKQDISQTLLQHRQYMLGPDFMTRLLQYGGPQADKVINIFNSLMQQQASVAFNFDELARATRYYLDTGRPVVDNFYELSRAVQYGGKAAEYTKTRFEQLSTKSINFQTILGGGTGGQEALELLQKQIGLNIAHQSRDVLASLSIGNTSVYLTLLQATFSGLLSIIQAITRLIRFINELPVLGPALQTAAAILTTVVTGALLSRTFVLLKLFLVNVSKDVLSTAALLRGAGAASTAATATLAAGTKGIARFFGALKVFMLTVAAQVRGITSITGLIGALSGPLGWILLAAGAVTATGIGLYSAYKNREQQNQAQQEPPPSYTLPYRLGGSAQGFQVYSPDNPDSPLFALRIEQMRDTVANVRKLQAALFKQLTTEDAQNYEFLLTLYRNFNISDKTSYQQAIDNINQQMQAKHQEFLRAKQQNDNAKAQLLQQELTSMGSVLTILSMSRDVVLKALQSATPVLERDATRDALSQQYQNVININRGVLLTKTKQEEADWRWEQAIRAAEQLNKETNKTLGKQEGVGLFLNEVATTTFGEMQLKIIEDAVNRRLQEARAAKSKSAELEATLASYVYGANAIEQQIRRLQADAKKAGTDPSYLTPVVSTLKAKASEYRRLANQTRSQLVDFSRQVRDTRDETVQRLYDTIKEALFGPSSTPSLTAKLLQQASSIYATSQNDPIEQAIAKTQAVEAEMAKLLPIARSYDQQVQEMLNRFDAARRSSDPQVRFTNLQNVLNRYLYGYQSLLRLPGLVSTLLDQTENALFKDGGQLASIAQLVNSGQNALQRLSEKTSNYGNFTPLGQLLEGLDTGVETLNAVADMVRQYQANYRQYTEVLQVLADSSGKRLRELLNNKVAKLEKEDSQLTKVEKQRLQQDIVNLRGWLSQFDRLAEIRQKLRSGGLSGRQQQRLKAEQSALEAQITTLRSNLNKRLEDAEIEHRGLFNSLREYVQSLDQALTSTTGQIKELAQNLRKTFAEQAKEAQEIAERFITSRSNDPLATLEREQKSVLDDLDTRIKNLQEQQTQLGKVLQSYQNATLLKTAQLVAQGRVLPKNATQAEKTLYEVLRSLDRALVIRLVNNLQTHDKTATIALKELTQDLQNQLAKLQNQKTQVTQAYEEALRPLTQLEQDLNQTDKALEAIAQAIEKEQYEAANSLLKQLSDQQTKFERRLTALQPILQRYRIDPASLQDQLEQTSRRLEELQERLLLEPLKIQVDQYQKELSQQPEGLALSVEQIDRGLILIETLQQALAKALIKNTKDTIKQYQDSIVETLLQKRVHYSQLQGVLSEERIILLEQLEQRYLLEKSLQTLRNNFKLGSLETIEQVEDAQQRLNAADSEAFHLRKGIESLAELGWDVSELLRQLGEIFDSLAEAQRTLNDRREQLRLEAINKAFNAANEVLDVALKEFRNVAISGQILPVDPIFQAIEKLRSLEKEVDPDKVKTIQTRLESLGDEMLSAITSAPEVFAKQYIQTLLGSDPLSFLTKQSGFGLVRDPRVYASLQNAVRAKMQEQFPNLALSNESIDQILKFLLDQAKTQVEAQLQEAEQSLRQLNFADIQTRVQQGDKFALRELGTRVEQFTQRFGNYIRINLLAEKFDDTDTEAAERVRQKFGEVQQAIFSGFSGTLQAIDEAVQQGQISVFDTQGPLQMLRDSLQTLKGLFATLAEQLGLSQEEMAKLNQELQQYLQQVNDRLLQMRNEAMRLVLRGDISSRQLQYQQQTSQMLLQARSGDFQGVAGLADLVLQNLRPGLLEKSNSQMFNRYKQQYLQALLMQSDDELLQALFPWTSSKTIRATLGQQFQDFMQALRASLKRGVNDLKEELQILYEQELLQLVQQFTNALQNLFMSVFTVPLQMLKQAREIESKIRDLQKEQRYAGEDADYWQRKYEEAVQTYGAMSEAAQQYATKVAEAKQRQDELRRSIDDARASAKNFFSYVLDALAKFIEELGKALAQWAANKAANAIGDFFLSLFRSIENTPKTIPSENNATQNQAKMSVQFVKMEGDLEKQLVQGGVQLAATGLAGGNVVQTGINVATGLAAAPLSSTVSGALGFAAGTLPAVAVSAGVALALSALADQISEIADKALNAKYYTFTYGAKARADMMPDVLPHLQQKTQVNVQVQAQLDRPKLIRETQEQLVRDLIAAGV